jgi:hypothetical protein
MIYPEIVRFDANAHTNLKAAEGLLPDAKGIRGALTRETIPSLVSEVFGGRPTRWTSRDRLVGDFDGRERTLDIFDASAGEQLALLRRLRPLRQEIEELIGGPLLVIFHTPKETARLYPEVARLRGGSRDRHM